MSRKFHARAIRRPLTPIACLRFFRYVVKSADCWIWTGYTDRKGYGQFWYNGKAQWAHRLSFATFVGRIPSRLTVNHKRICRNPSCVNPAHLELMTVSQNSKARFEECEIPL